MNIERVSLGFDLRLNPDLQKDNPSQQNQHLVPALRSPVSVDQNVWVETEEIESLMDGVLPDFANPLHLAKSLELLVDACQNRGIATINLWPVCVTTVEPNVIALTARYGPGYFDNQATERDLLSRGWRFVGFDIVDLSGLISGLKGCGYVEPTWSQLRDRFSSDLNDVGLFSDWAAASEFAEVRGLEIREHAPFVVAGLLVQDHE